MTVTAKTLAEGIFATASNATPYTASGVHAIIDKFTATNTDSSSRTLSVYLVPSGGSPTAANIVIQTLSISAGATVDLTQLQNHILNPGDFVSIVASVTSVVSVRISGREIS